eukprot:883456-Rhodomonas_salina.2
MCSTEIGYWAMTCHSVGAYRTCRTRLHPYGSGSTIPLNQYCTRRRTTRHIQYCIQLTQYCTRRFLGSTRRLTQYSIGRSALPGYYNT